MAESKETSAAVAATKTSPSKQETDMAQQALNHLVQGKRHLLVRDIPSAVTSLQEACSLLGGQYGETANECGEAYFHYGHALLEMARIETEVIANPLKDDEKSDEDEDEKEEDNDEDDAEGDEEGEKDEESEKDVDKEGESEKDGEESEKDGEEKDEDGQEDGKDDAKADGDDKSAEALSETDDKEEESLEDKKGESEDDSEVTTLQLAWEMLELAKVIFKRQAESTGETPAGETLQLRLAEAHLKLGEVSLESENYGQAEEEMLCCLEIRTRLLPPHNRLLAETRFQLGLATSLAEKFDSAQEHYQAAAGVLRERIHFLQERLERRKKGEDEVSPEAKADPFYTEQNEIFELEKLLPDIEEKMADTQASKEEVSRRIREGFFGDGGGLVAGSSSGANGAGPSSSAAAAAAAAAAFASPDAPSTPTKPASNISHLVRKKRKPEDLLAAVMAAPDPKRVCLAEDGDGKTDGEKDKINGNGSHKEEDLVKPEDKKETELEKTG